jgi:hypothetical protein
MTAGTLPIAKYRIESIDILRGLIMLIMALDHTRDFFHQYGPDPTNVASTTLLLFFTRWITHFCAASFVFLSGVSVILAGSCRSKKQLSLFLIKRGLWLIVVEFVLISLAITFDPQGYRTDQISDPKSMMLFHPVDFGFNLLGVYGVWVLVIVILYFPCRWFSQYKRKNRQWWLSYV